MTNGWIGVDLDGTLAYCDQWRGAPHIGEPIPLMLGGVTRARMSVSSPRVSIARASLWLRQVVRPCETQRLSKSAFDNGVRSMSVARFRLPAARTME